jgi:uncharacterized protein (UPF0262 family)
MDLKQMPGVSTKHGWTATPGQTWREFTIKAVTDKCQSLSTRPPALQDVLIARVTGSGDKQATLHVQYTVPMLGIQYQYFTMSRSYLSEVRFDCMGRMHAIVKGIAALCGKVALQHYVK